MYKIFLVEDDLTIAREIAAHLGAQGFEVQAAEDFRDVTAAFAAAAPHLVLMDITLPFYSGYYWCAQIRAVSQVPILFLSSAADNMNIVMAVNMGGDDFLAKPFDLGVLVAKIQALLRRAYDFGGPADLLQRGEAVLDLGTGNLNWRGQSLELTKNELRILKVLFEAKGKVVSRDALMASLWATDCYIDDNTLTVNVARLRKKLEGIGLEGMIRTKKGMGYQVE